jgi:ATP-binding cassette subfamily B protein
MVVLKTITASLSPLYVKKSVDYLSNDFELNQVLDYVWIIISIAFINGLFLFAMRRITIGASRLIENDFRNDFFEKLQTLDMNFFHHNQTGDLMARATNDMANIRSVFGPAVMYSVNLVFSFVVYLYMMIEISPSLTFWAVLPLPIMAIVVYVFGQMIYKKQAVIQKLYSDISNFAQENLAGIRVVKSFALEQDQIGKFSELNSTYFKRMVNFLSVNSLFHPSIFLIISFGLAAILYVGGNQVIEGTITIGDLTAFILYLGMLAWPSIAVGWVAGLFQTGASSMKRVQAIFSEVPSVVEAENDVSLEFKESIEFKDLTFTYPNADEPTLQNISLRLSKGETLGIVGQVGCGKSTLVGLLNRMYQVEDDMLFIDGSDINTYHTRALNRGISVVPQETFLFSTSIKNNIQFSGEKDDTVLNNAINNAQLKETIDGFELGVETLLGERGVNLSGGQKQRVAIARALVKQSPILVLDDCLSAVDAETERQILDAFRSEGQSRTMLIISHRMSTVQHADNIIFLEHGRIVEEGNHAKLMGLGGRYAKLYQKQQIEAQLESIN